MNRILEQIDVVIESARSAQAEDGPDPDYRRAAMKALEYERMRLVKMIERSLA